MTKIIGYIMLYKYLGCDQTNFSESLETSARNYVSLSNSSDYVVKGLYPVYEKLGYGEVLQEMDKAIVKAKKRYEEKIKYEALRDTHNKECGELAGIKQSLGLLRSGILLREEIEEEIEKRQNRINKLKEKLDSCPFEYKY